MSLTFNYVNNELDLIVQYGTRYMNVFSGEMYGKKDLKKANITNPRAISCLEWFNNHGYDDLYFIKGYNDDEVVLGHYYTSRRAGNGGCKDSEGKLKLINAGYLGWLKGINNKKYKEISGQFASVSLKMSRCKWETLYNIISFFKYGASIIPKHMLKKTPVYTVKKKTVSKYEPKFIKEYGLFKQRLTYIEDTMINGKMEEAEDILRKYNADIVNEYIGELYQCENNNGDDEEFKQKMYGKWEENNYNLIALLYK